MDQLTPEKQERNTEASQHHRIGTKEKLISLQLLIKGWQIILGFAIVAFFIQIAIFSPLIAPREDPLWASKIRWEDDAFAQFPHPPSAELPLGTIPLRFHKQVDVFTGLVHGTRSALIFGVSAAFFTGLIGVILGAISAWAGGWLNSLIMRITDAVLALPVIVGVVVLQQVLLMLTTAQTYGLYYGLGEEITPVGFSGFIVWLIRTLDPVLLAVILFSWMPYARITNTVVFQVKGSGYIQAAKALGGSSAHTIFRHIIPNSITPAVVLFARDIGGFVLLQATFTFIGLGGESEWGATLAYARDWIIGPGGDLLSRWWVFIPATLTLVLFGIGWNLLGDGLNDWLNPRLRREIQM